MNRKQLKQAKAVARKELRKRPGILIASSIRTVSIVCLVVSMYLLARSLNFDAEHWDYGAKTTPVTDYLAVVALSIFGEWCGDYFLDQSIYNQQMMPFSVYVKRGSRRLFYPTLSIIGMVLVQVTHAPNILGNMWFILMVITYFSIRLSEIGVTSAYLRTWNYRQAIKDTRPQGPRAWLQVLHFHFSFLLWDMVNILLMGVPGIISIPYKRMTERVIYEPAMLAEKQEL